MFFLDDIFLGLTAGNHAIKNNGFLNAFFVLMYVSYGVGFSEFKKR